MTNSKIDRLVDKFFENSRNAKALTVCVGPGASRAAGMPSWDALLEKTLKDHRLDRKLLDYLKTDTEHALEYVQHLTGSHQLFSDFKSIVEALEPIELHYAIASLPARSFITTNYDTTLERAIAESGKFPKVVVKDSDLAMVDNRSTPIIKVNGGIEEIDTLLFSKYDRRKEHDTLRSYLRATFATGLVLFIGFTLEGDFLELYENFRGPSDSDWVFIAPSGDDPAKHLWSIRGIRFIDVDYTDIPLFLRRLTTKLLEDKPIVRRAKRARQVFLSAGRNQRIKHWVRDALVGVGYEPAAIGDKPSQGLSLIEKLEKVASESSVAIVILEGRSELEYGSGGIRRGRMNTFLELGYLLGTLGRENVLVICDSFVEWPSDLASVQFVVVDLDTPSMVISALENWLIERNAG